MYPGFLERLRRKLLPGQQGMYTYQNLCWQDVVVNRGGRQSA
jgi:hypothetical protein